jgi:NDP-sugar pyrophosphorylase family protein
MPQPASSPDEPAPLMFTGIQILEPEIFNYIPSDIYSDSVTDVYPKAMAAGERIAAHVGTGRWFEMSTIQRYRDISLHLMAERELSFTAGSNSSISPDAEVNGAILWDNVSIAPGARVTRAILGDDVTISEGEVITDAAVVRASLVLGKEAPPKAMKGEFRGSNFVVPLTQ